MRSSLSQVSIHKLEVFCLVAECASVSRAAERLQISQPVISGHIKSLAAKVGVPLTVRIGRRLALTEEGRTVYRWAREVVSRTRELEREVEESQSGLAGSATLAASMTLGSYVLPGLVTAFRRLAPNGNVSVRVTAPMLAVDAVQAGECDFAYTILGHGHDPGDLEIRHVVEEPLVLVAPASSDIGTDGLSLAALAELPFVTAQSGTPRREIEENCLRQYGIAHRHTEMEFGHGESIKQAVRAGAGTAFLLRSSVRDELASGVLRVIETPGMQLQVPVFLVLRKSKRLSSFQISLMRFIQSALQEQEPSECRA